MFACGHRAREPRGEGQGGCCSSVMKHSKPCLPRHFERKCHEGRKGINDDTANKEEKWGGWNNRGGKKEV